MFQKLANYFQGRHTLAIVWFAVTGLILALLRRLDPSYVALCATLQGYIFAHSTKEDYFATKGPSTGGLG